MNKKISSIASTIMGCLVAISMALVVIDFKNFDFVKEWPKVILLSLIALGGFVTKIKTDDDYINKDKNNEKNI